MPLRKLFNALRKPAATAASTLDANATADTAAIAAAKTGIDRRLESVPDNHVVPAKRVPASGEPSGCVTRSKPQPTRRFRREKSPHADLTAALAAVSHPGPVITVLEIGVGDGTRAVAVTSALHTGANEIRYAAIDQFEAATASQTSAVAPATTLMEFHRTLRAAGVRPQVFPQDIAAGIQQFSRTLGGADIVILSAGHDLTTVATPLAKITHPATVVLAETDGRWIRQTLPQTHWMPITAAA